MSDTFGGLIDKLITIDMKMWTNQEFLYESRRMTFEEFKEAYIESEEQKRELYDSIQKCCDLNYQRNQLIDEIDEKIVEIIRAGLSGEDLDVGKFIQRKHKTY